MILVLGFSVCLVWVWFRNVAEGKVLQKSVSLDNEEVEFGGV